jgi:hypothetical protein
VIGGARVTAPSLSRVRLSRVTEPAPKTRLATVTDQHRFAGRGYKASFRRKRACKGRTSSGAEYGYARGTGTRMLKENVDPFPGTLSTRTALP